MTDPQAQRSIGNILINPAFQLRILAYATGLFIATTGSLYLASYLFFRNFKKKALEVGIPNGHIFYDFIDNLKHDLDFMYLGLSAVYFLLLVGLGFMLSHRVAGPLFKLRHYLHDLGPESTEFRLRETDFFRDLEPVVNELKGKFK